MPLEFHDGFELGGKYQGALILPPENGPWLKKLRLLALGRSALEIELEVTKEEMHLRHLPMRDLRFPR